MKIRLLLIAVGFGTLAMAQKPVTVQSTINKVILFSEGGQVMRTAKSTIDAGKTELIFENISPEIDKQSIQVKGEGAFTILSVSHTINYLKQQAVSDEISRLLRQKDKLGDQITYQNSMLNVYKQEQSIMEKNQSIGGANTGVNAENLKAVADFQHARLTEVYLQQNELSKKIKSLNDSVTLVTSQLYALNAKKEKPTSEIHVTVMAKTSVQANFEISYYVHAAGWYANYDLRVEKVNTPVEISYKANIYQSSGEDWKNVQITLSNGNPNESGIAPTLYPWRLYYGNVSYDKKNGYDYNYANTSVTHVSGKVTDATGEALPFATVVVKGTTVGTVTDVDGNYTLQLPAGANYLSISYLGFIQREVHITSTLMNISMPESTQTLEEVMIMQSPGVVSEGVYSRNAGKLSNSSKSELKTIALETNFEYKPTTFTHDIKEPYTILSDGKVQTIDIQALKVDAQYEYYAVPKIDRDAFLTAKITDWQDLNLLAGEANLFFEGAYLGKTILDITNAKDTLNISLGRDKGVVIQRNKLKEFTERQFIGTNKKETIAFEIAIRNNKQEPIQIIIKDQFPIATESDMEVEQIETSGGKVSADEGIISWNLQIAPKEEKKLVMKYSVKYPKSKTVVLE